MEARTTTGLKSHLLIITPTQLQQGLLVLARGVILGTKKRKGDLRAPGSSQTGKESSTWPKTIEG
jgi:hypothetical protein